MWGPGEPCVYISPRIARPLGKASALTAATVKSPSWVIQIAAWHPQKWGLLLESQNNLEDVVPLDLMWVGGCVGMLVQFSYPIWVKVDQFWHRGPETKVFPISPRSHHFNYAKQFISQILGFTKGASTGLIIHRLLVWFEDNENKPMGFRMRMPALCIEIDFKNPIVFYGST